ncbi:MAG: type II toxin-antitoxin system death-on-curing family toxin [Candidatus Lokiarchaeota archaeon]|nr:type II toxin-antitoxin system death-on-curing family toxin [Candidatus Lokiarchaeota archaeon]
MWFPDLQFILGTFTLLKELPECSDLIKDKCVNPNGLNGTLDKVKFGLPFKKSTYIEKASILIHDIVLYHYFTDGNKRIGFLSMVIFLKKNGKIISASEDEKVEFTLEIARGKSSLEDISSWIFGHLNIE